MTDRLELPKELREAIAEGKTVVIKDSTFGPAGHNGELELGPVKGKYSTEGGHNPDIPSDWEIKEE